MLRVCGGRIIGADVSRESPQEDGHEQDGIYQKHAVEEAQTQSCAETENSLGSAGAVWTSWARK
jgi:hypothetical protein